MAQEARLALRQFVAALEKHFEAVATRRGEEDPSVEQAYYQIEDALLNYEDALWETYEEELPIVLREEDD